MVNESHIFILADQALNNVVQQIGDDQWSLTIPDWISVGRVSRDGLDLRMLLNHHAYDDIWVPDMLAGRTMAEVGVDKWKDEDLLGEDPKASFAAVVETAIAAAERVTAIELEQAAHLSFGNYTIHDYFLQINQFRAIRAIEIAELIGVDSQLSDELLQGIWDELAPHAEEWRAIGVFGPLVEVPDDAPLQTRLLALTGRTVH